MLGGDGEDCQAFENVYFSPVGELRRGGLVTFDEAVEFVTGVVSIFRVEDVSDVVGDLFSQFDFGRVLHRVLGEVKLAAWPGDSGKRRLPGRLESFVSVADDQLDSVQTTLLERDEKLAPMNSRQ